MVTCVIFDIDGTLIDESVVLEAQTNAVAWKFGDSFESKQAVVDHFFAANDKAVREGGEYKNNIKQYMKWIGENLSIQVTDGEAEKLALDWGGAFQNSSKTPQVFSDSEHCLRLLRERELTIVAVSGGTVEKKKQLLEDAGIASYFDAVYAATDIGFQKQDIYFWHELLKILQVDVSACVVVGNQINDDIMHPKSLGMRTVLVERPGLLRKDLGPKDVQPGHTIRNLEGLTELIK